jgi:hypothetical protein
MKNNVPTKICNGCSDWSINDGGFITNILAGSVSPGLDAPRVAGSFP